MQHCSLKYAPEPERLGRFAYTLSLGKRFQCVQKLIECSSECREIPAAGREDTFAIRVVR
jgi:hypothetical protein